MAALTDSSDGPVSAHQYSGLIVIGGTPHPVAQRIRDLLQDDSGCRKPRFACFVRFGRTGYVLRAAASVRGRNCLYRSIRGSTYQTPEMGLIGHSSSATLRRPEQGDGKGQGFVSLREPWWLKAATVGFRRESASIQSNTSLRSQRQDSVASSSPHARPASMGWWFCVARIVVATYRPVFPLSATQNRPESG